MNLVRFPTKEESDLSVKNTFYKHYQINNLKNACWSKNLRKIARYNTYITKDTQVLKNKTKFMVDDLERIFYADDYKLVYDDFLSMSTKMLSKRVRSYFQQVGLKKSSLKYYDVNCLYLVGLKKSKMELKDMFGFIKAFIIRPAGMHKPFLPYK